MGISLRRVMSMLHRMLEQLKVWPMVTSTPMKKWMRFGLLGRVSKKLMPKVIIWKAKVFKCLHVRMRRWRMWGKTSSDELRERAKEVAEQGDGSSGQHLAKFGIKCRKIEVPNNKLPGRRSQFSSNNLIQEAYRPHGPGGAPQFGIRGPQPMPYDYHQQGPYPSQNQPYPGQSYTTYPPQGPPRGRFSSGWEHRPPVQGPPHAGGYNYYGQGSEHAANVTVPAPQSAYIPGHASAPPQDLPMLRQRQLWTTSSCTDSSNLWPWIWCAPRSSAAALWQSRSQQQGYASQQSFNGPQMPYGMLSQGAPQGYTHPTASQPQPAGASYQALVPYGTTPVTNDSYAQPQPQAAAAGYPQQGGQPVAAYGQQAAAGYPQAAGLIAGYGQYQSAAQAGYSDPSASAAAPNAAIYGYQRQVDQSTYAASHAYRAAPTVTQQGYAQPQTISASQPGYDQSAAQLGGYASAPGYSQYDASLQMYATPR